MVIKTEYHKITSYITKHGSDIRELMRPDIHGNANQSLAEATVPVGTELLPHRHIRTEELYHIVSGLGLMTLGSKQFDVKKGDTILIPPSTSHKIRNMGSVPLKILCCCSPAYSDEDTELL